MFLVWSVVGTQTPGFGSLQFGNYTESASEGSACSSRGAPTTDHTREGAWNNRCGCVRAHGYGLTGKMTGGPPNQIGGPWVITLVESSVITQATSVAVSQKLWWFGERGARGHFLPVANLIPSGRSCDQDRSAID